MGVFAPDAQRHAAHDVRAAAAEFQRIPQQVVQDLAQPGWITQVQAFGRGVHEEVEPHAALISQRFEEVAHTFGQPKDINLLGFEFEALGLDLGEVQHIVNDPQ